MAGDGQTRIGIGRRRFLQGTAAAAAAAALPLPKALASGRGGCGPFTTTAVYLGSVTDPSSFLGFTIGVDQEVTAAEAEAYTTLVAQQSDRVIRRRYGTSVQGRPLTYAIVGKPENVTPAGLEAVRRANLKIRDPKTPKHQVEQLARTTPAICWVIGNIHGSEESGTDTELEILYELADRDDCVVRTLLDHLVVLIIPCQNPDGRELDQRRNANGFDLNRDVFARTQPETDSRVEVMRRYPPVLLVDDHEFGYYRAFFPPNNDPIYHETPDRAVRWINDTYGPAIAREYVKEDMPFFHGGVYDFFSPQYNDTGSTFGFGAAGMTIECYNGMHLSKRFRHHYVASMASLWQAAQHTPRILRGLHQEFVDAVEEGRKGTLERNHRYFFLDRRIHTVVPRYAVRNYFILNDDPGKADNARRLVRRLQRMDVEVHRLTAPLRVPDFRPYTRDPRVATLPKGTYWISMAQPQKHWIQALLNEDSYMPTQYTYGLTGWSNALLMNVDGGSSGAAVHPRAVLQPPLSPPVPPALPSPLPAVGVYQMSFGSYAEESVGATRWLFDSIWNLPYTYLTEVEILAGGLDGLDVLVAPGGGFQTALRKLGHAGQKALVDFVNGGGRYVGYRGGGAKLAAALGLTTALLRDPRASIPGSVVRVEVDPDSPLSHKVGPFTWVLFDSDDVVFAPKGICPVRYPTAGSGDFFVSGYADGEEQLYGSGAVVDQFSGRGRVVLMPSDPNSGGHVEGMWQLLWNAMVGRDPKRPAVVAKAGSPERVAAEAAARHAVMSRPDWPGAFHLAVPAREESAARDLLRRFDAEFVVNHGGGRSRFTIRNPGELSLEEHPWAIGFVLALQESGLDVVSFSAR